MGWDSEFLETSSAFKSDRDVRTAVTQVLQAEQSALESAAWDHHLKEQQQHHQSQHQLLQRQRLNHPSNISSFYQRWGNTMVESLMKNNAELINTNPNTSAFMNSIHDSKVRLEALPPGLDEASSGSGGGTINTTNNNVQPLGAPSSIGAGATKVSKKRSRASRRPPTTVLEADSANFRSMVQQLTGIPSPPPGMLTHHHHGNGRFDFLGSGLVRPQATRAGAYGGITPAIFRSHATLLQQQQQQYATFTRSIPGYTVRNYEQHVSPNVTRPLQLSFSNSNQALYAAAAAAQSGPAAPSGGLSMPSLWECEARGGENTSMNIKREVTTEETTAGTAAAGGTSSWSTSL